MGLYEVTITIPFGWALWTSFPSNWCSDATRNHSYLCF